MIRFLCGLVGLPIGILASSTAHSATPPQLFNTSVRASLNVSMTARDEAGQTRQVLGAIRQAIYISSRGRIFVRQTLTSAFSASSQDMPVASSASISGHTMVLRVPLIRGSASARITFGSQFTNCSVAGTVRSASIRFKGSDNRIYESVSPITLGTSTCSIQTGNVFGR
jgi:hypothetical protein